MKTVKEWLKELPEPYRSQALENIEIPECTDGQKHTHDTVVGSSSDAVSKAFWHGQTPQGRKYWYSLIRRLESKELLKEFAEWFTAQEYPIQSYDCCSYLCEKNVTDFLNHKYGEK